MERGEGSGARVERVAAFVVVAASVVVLALNGGGYDTVDRQAAGLLVWWVLGLSLALGLLPRSRPRRIAFAPVVALALLAGWTLLSLGWTQSDERTLAEVARVAGYAGLLLLVLLAIDHRTRHAAAAGLATGALAVSGLAVACWLVPSLLPTDTVGSVVERLSYPFGYWNAVGVWGAMAVGAGLSWSVCARQVVARAAFLAAVPVAGLSIYLSYSRASIAGLVVGLVVVVSLSRPLLVTLAHAAAAGLGTAAVILVARGQSELARGNGTDGAVEVALALALAGVAVGAVVTLSERFLAERSWAMPARQLRFAGLVAGAPLLVALAVAGPGLASRAWDSFKNTEDQAVITSGDPAARFGSLQGSRYLLWSVALDEFPERPGTGTGAGTYEFTWNRAGRSPVFVRDAHSIYIEPLTELGWPGALLVLTFVACLVLAGLAVLRRADGPGERGTAAACLALLAVWLVQAGVDWMWEMTAVSALALAAAAICAAGLGGRRPATALSLGGRLAAAVGCLVVCALFVPGLVSTSFVRDSQESVRAGDIARAAREASDAVEAEPWGATPLLQRATVAEARGRLRAARTDLRRAARREPRNWRPPMLLARVEAELGRPGAALRQFRRARGLRPRAVIFESLATAE